MAADSDWVALVVSQPVERRPEQRLVVVGSCSEHVVRPDVTRTVTRNDRGTGGPEHAVQHLRGRRLQPVVERRRQRFADSVEQQQ